MIYPSGITAFSRWLSEATPPEHDAPARIRSWRDRSNVALASLRDARPMARRIPAVALRLPPANGLNPFGVKTADGTNYTRCVIDNNFLTMDQITC